MATSPKSVQEKIEKMLNAWETLTPDKSFGGMTFAQFKASAQPSLDARSHIDDLEAQMTQAIATREAADEAFLAKAQLVIAGVLADPTEGPDSALYQSFGYTRKSDRKSGLTRRKSTKTDAATKQ